MSQTPHLWRRLQLLDRAGALVALLAVWSLFAALRFDTFATWENTQSILLQTAVVGIAALGATVIIISGGIDLSVGSLIALVSVVIALATKTLSELPFGLSRNTAASIAALEGIAAAGAVGLVIGTLVIGHAGRVAALLLGILAGILAQIFGITGWGAIASGATVGGVGLWINRKWLPVIPLSPFIVTLGMWGALRGMAKGLADNSALYAPQTFLNSFMRLPQGEGTSLWHPAGWWSPGVWVFLGLALFVAAVLRYTQFGRHVFAIGSNEQTARLCGIDVERTKLKLYTFAALLAGVAGVMQYSFVTLGDPTTAGGYELKVIAAVVIGGGSLTGGVGTVLGTVAGALLMTIIDNGCTKVGLEVWMQEILTGVIIIAAVILDQFRRRALTPGQ